MSSPNDASHFCLGRKQMVRNSSSSSGRRVGDVAVSDFNRSDDIRISPLLIYISLLSICLSRGGVVRLAVGPSNLACQMKFDGVCLQIFKWELVG